MRIGCPQCNNPIDALDRDRINGITCPVCESPLRVVWDPAWAERGGLVVGPMTLEQLIRVSFYGDVYKGYHPAHGPVAVTILSKRDTRRKWNFIDDGRLLSRMGHHARIAKVLGVGEDDEYYYQVSSLDDQGKDLAASMAEVYPTADEAAGRIADVAEDLHKAHGENVIHGSICPATFLVGDLNKVCLVDFTMGRRDLEQVTVNTAGRVLDSAAFASPEQVAGCPVDRRSDVYGLGALLYLMLTGWPPYLGGLARVKEQVLAGDPRPPSSLVPSVPPVLELICMKALAREPGSRYASALEFAEDLRRYLRNQPVQARPVALAVPPVLRRVAGSRALVRGAAATAAVVLVVLVTLGLVKAAARVPADRPWDVPTIEPAENVPPPPAPATRRASRRVPLLDEPSDLTEPLRDPLPEPIDDRVRSGIERAAGLWKDRKYGQALEELKKAYQYSQSEGQGSDIEVRCVYAMALVDSPAPLPEDHPPAAEIVEPVRNSDAEARLTKPGCLSFLARVVAAQGDLKAAVEYQQRALDALGAGDPRNGAYRERLKEYLDRPGS